MKDTAYKALKIKEKYINNNQKEPTLEEIAKELSITKEDLVFALDSIQEPISLYEQCFKIVLIQCMLWKDCATTNHAKVFGLRRFHSKMLSRNLQSAKKKFCICVIIKEKPKWR